MPINEIKQKGKLIGYKWGKSGKLYLIKAYGKRKAYIKALQQSKAIYVNKYKKWYGDNMVLIQNGKTLYEPTSPSDKVCNICKNIGKVSLKGSMVPRQQILENVDVTNRGIQKGLRK